MTTINLLPWREQLRQQRKKEFGIMIGVAVAFSIFINIVIYLIVDSRIKEQISINQFYQDEIVKLDKEIKKVDDIKQLKANLLARMEVIQNLERTRPAAVHLLDEFANIVPEGVYINKISKEGDVITVLGDADSNSRVSTLMRNIEASKWITDPVLTEIKSDSANTLYSRDFTLQMKQKIPKAMDGDKETSDDQGVKSGS